MSAASARDRLTETVTSAARSGVETVRAIPVVMWGLPFVLSAVIWAITKTPVGWITEKPVQEIAAPVVIGLSAGLVLMVHKWAQARFTLILACFVWSLFLRELHFWGTNNGFYIALVAIIIWTWASRSQLIDFLQFSSIRHFLSGAFLIYLLSKIVDRGYLAFLPEFSAWRHNLEETLETSGHVMVFCLVVMSYRIATLPGKQSLR
jgi:hypothetical protein